MNACECGHDPADHDERGCYGENERDFGAVPCNCDRYRWQGDE